MLEAQHATIRAAASVLETRMRVSIGTEAILLRFRLESTRAVLRFVEGLLDNAPELEAAV
jgi:hypothetical protein